MMKYGLLFAAAISAAISLSGCIVVPYAASQGKVGSGADVAATVPDSIVKGKTTRAEVLQDDGKPDGEGSDWVVYSSTAKESGLGLFFCFAAKSDVGCGTTSRQVWDYRRLVVRFDAAGLVSDAHVDSASCLQWSGNSGPVPCLDLRGDDLRRVDALASIQQSKQVLATYPSVRWPADQENGCTFYGKLTVAQDALYFVASADSPFDKGRHQVDPARCPEPDSTVAFDDAGIADIALVRGMSGDQAVKLSRKDGSHFTWQFLTDDGAGFHVSSLFVSNDLDEAKVDDSTLAHATELAADIQKATGKSPDAFGGLAEAAAGGARTYDHIRWCSGWDPLNIPLVATQTPCERPKDGYLILTATGFMFQLADAGDGLNGLVASQYVDVQAVGIRDSGRWGSYSHWVVVETKGGQVDAFDPDDSDRREEINSIIQSHLSQPHP